MSWHTEDPLLWGEMQAVDWTGLIQRAQTIEDIARGLKCEPEEVLAKLASYQEEIEALHGKLSMLQAGLEEYRKEHEDAVSS